MFHLSVKTISRAAGRSATAAIAYRSGSKIIDERTGEIHDYTKKNGVEHSEIVLPGGAPFWASNRPQLWNAAELAEKRVNSTVAREFEIGIPKDLTLAQGIDLVRDFAEQLVDKHRFAADFSIHKDDKYKWDGTEKGYEGYHAHILCTTRRLESEGMGKKTRELDGMQAGRESVEHWRERWEVTANQHLELAGKVQRIDHRSLKDQGVNREPTQHIGPTATALERKGVHTMAGNANRRIEAAYWQGIADRRALATVAKRILILDQNIKRALLSRDQESMECVDQLVEAASFPVVFDPLPRSVATAFQLLDKNIDVSSEKSVVARNRWSDQKALQQKLVELGRQSLKDRGAISDHEEDAPKIYHEGPIGGLKL